MDTVNFYKKFTYFYVEDSRKIIYFISVCLVVKIAQEVTNKFQRIFFFASEIFFHCRHFLAINVSKRGKKMGEKKIPLDECDDLLIGKWWLIVNHAWCLTRNNIAWLPKIEIYCSSFFFWPFFDVTFQGFFFLSLNKRVKLSFFINLPHQFCYLNDRYVCIDYRFYSVARLPEPN